MYTKHISQRRIAILVVFVSVIVILTMGFLYAYVQSDTYYLARVARAENPGQALIRDTLGFIERNGAPRTVALVAQALEQKLIDTNECHLILHLLGHSSYRIYGEDFAAINAANEGRICLNGYFHGVEAEIAVSGDKRALADFCVFEKQSRIDYGPCYHGVGHAIFELNRNVKESLAFCDSLKGGPEPDLDGCYRGVFSEIGNQLGGRDSNSGLEITPLRDKSQRLVAEKPYAVCTTVGMKYKDACHTQLSKLYYSESDPHFGTGGCLTSSASLSVVSTCTRIVSALALRTIFSHGTVSDAADFFNTLPQSQRTDALGGARDVFESERRSVSVWNEFCALVEGESLQVTCRAKAVGLQT